MAKNRRPRRPSFRSPLVFDSPEALELHREFEYLTVASRRFQRGSRRQHQRRLDHRARKLESARRDYREIEGDE